jgi:hypothetical protein
MIQGLHPASFWVAALLALAGRAPLIPIGFRLARFEFVKLPTGKAFTIQNQNGITLSSLDANVNTFNSKEVRPASRRSRRSCLSLYTRP